VFSVTVVTIFPEIFPGPLGHGLSGKGLGKLWELRLVNIRDFATDKHRKVDDSPCGGGAGMIMKPDVVHDALSYALELHSSKRNRQMILFMSPRGEPFSQKMVRSWFKDEVDGLIILCGRYEGIDQRVIDFWIKNHGMLEISVGDFVLFGGELPAMCVIDACLRQIPGIMHNETSTETESFSVDLLEYPQYTRPCEWNGEKVPAVLLSGNHGEIERWRLAQSESTTKELRRDLWERYERNGD
jgi:tRNA (guanine37-N1)-methyltransferase